MVRDDSLWRKWGVYLRYGVSGPVTKVEDEGVCLGCADSEWISGRGKLKGLWRILLEGGGKKNILLVEREEMCCCCFCQVFRGFFFF